MSETVLNKSILEEFKESELGRLPKSWEVKSLGDISSFRRGSFPQPYGNPEWYSKEGYPFVQVYDIAENNRLKASTKVRISEAAASQSVFIPKGSLIVSLQGSIGRVAITQYDSYVDRTILIFSNFESKLDTNYFSTIIRELFRNKSVVADGGIIKTITKETLRKFKIKIPPLPEQKKITSILNSVDDVIEKTQSQINKLQDLKKGTMNELLTKGIGHTEFEENELGKVPKKWRTLKMSDITTFLSNGFVGSASQYYRNTGVPYLVSKNIRENRIDAEKMTYIAEEFHKANIGSQLKKNDLPTVQSGHVGVSAVVTENFDNTNCHALIISRFKKEIVNSNFLSYYFNSSIGKKRLFKISVGSTIPHINTKDLKKFSVPLPKLEEQVKIVSLLKTLDTTIKNKNLKLEKYQSLKKSLMQDLLTGKVRVSVN